MIQLTSITKAFQTPAGTVEALKDVSLTIPTGSIFGIIGVSGAGKSTLVRCINLLEQPTSGSVIVDGQDVTHLRAHQLRQYRRRVAMIFQNFGLLGQKNVLQNVCFPFLAANGRVSAENKERALHLLDVVQLAEKPLSYPSQLSGGQKQRVAIARALALEPDYLLCDEATSALDPASTASVLETLKRVNEQTGVTEVVITHDMDVVRSICTHVAVIDAGRVVECGEAAQVLAAPQSLMAKRLLGKADWND